MDAPHVLRMLRIGQLTGSTADSWPLLVDPVGAPLLTDTGRWHVVGVDEGANAEHSDGRLYFFFGDVATNQTPDDPPLNADLVAWTDERAVSAHGGHLAIGLNFQLPIAHPGIEGQDHWQFCLKCSALFWNGDDHFKGRCPAGDTHNTFGLGLNFALPFEPTGTAGQHQWRFCVQCGGLFWNGDPHTNGICPAGATHAPAGLLFVLPTTPAPMNGQPDWRFCANCHGLFWDGEASKGFCAGAPGGGFHLRGVLENRTQVGRFDPFRAAEPIGFTGSNETPNGAFSFHGRMYVFAGFPDSRFASRIRPGEPMGGQYLFSKADPSLPGPYETEFLFSPKLGWCALDESRSSFASHDILGLRFVASHDLPPTSGRQSGWRCCSRCEAMFFDGNSGFKGVCQRGQAHQADSAVVGNFSFERDLAEDSQNQSHWRCCDRCLALYWGGDPHNPGLCPAGGLHTSTGPQLRVAHHSIDADAVHQPDWRFCRKCFALFWNGDQGVPNGCAKDHGRHEAAGHNFLLPHDIAEDPGSQTRWRFCGKCTALFFAGAGNGHCPTDNGSHAPAGFVFTLRHSTPESLDHQTNWRRCTKCSCLYFDGFPDNGTCPLDGQGHETDPTSPRFTLAHNPGEDDNTRGSLRFCLRCHGLVRTDQSSVFPWTAPTVVDNAEHPLLESDAGQGVVMISYDWTNFSLSWLPLHPGGRPRFDTVRYYHAGNHRWGDLPDTSAGYQLFAHRLPGQYTHVSASWLPGPRQWIVLYSEAWDKSKQFTQPIVARFSPDLVTWTDRVPIFDPTAVGGYGSYMHDPAGSDHIHPNLPPSQPPGQNDPGWAYGAFVLDRFTSWDSNSRVLALHYLCSLGSPYQVQLMRSDIRLP